MKPILCLLLVLAPVSSLFAQGTIAFGNVFGTTLRSPVYGPDPNAPFTSRQGNAAVGCTPFGAQTYGGALLAGTGYTVSFCTMFNSNYVEIGRTVIASHGLWLQRTVTDPNHPAGSSTTAIVRIWDNQGGTITNWAQALASSAPLGQSAPMEIFQLGGGTILTPLTSAIRSFNLYYRGGAFLLAQPADVVAPAGGSARMEVQVQVASGVGDPSFQWKRDGTDIPGATSATLVLTDLQHTDAGGYQAVVTVPSLTMNSRVARLIVQPKIAGIEHHFIPEWGADAIRLSYDSTPLRPVRVEVRSTLLDTWINMGQFVNPTVHGTFFDIGPTNDTRFYRLSLVP